MEMGRATVTPKCQKIVNIQKTCFHTDQKDVPYKNTKPLVINSRDHFRMNQFIAC